MEQETIDEVNKIAKEITQKNTQFVISRTERPNSYEFGKAGNRFKLYFDTPEDLKAQMDRLAELGIYVEIGEI